MGQHPYPAPPSRRPRHGTEYTPSCEHRRSPPLRGSPWCGSPRHHSTPPGGPGPWAPPQTGSYGGTRGPRGSPASPPNAGGWPPAPGRAGLTPQPAPHPPPPRRAPHGTAHGTALMHQEVVGRVRLPPRMPTRITVMADSDGSPQRDDRDHRRFRYAPPPPRSGRGRPSRSARSGGWRRRRCWSGRRCRPGSLSQPR